MIASGTTTVRADALGRPSAADWFGERLHGGAVPIGDPAVADEAARDYRARRDRGIATRCIVDRLPLLYSGRDFDPFVERPGLRSAFDLPTEDL